MAEDPSLADLGEWELIDRLARFAPPGQFADDAALVDLSAVSGGSGGSLVVTTDVLVDSVHFSDATTAPGDVGWRAASASLSDLAAMGCRHALGLTVALVAPISTRWSWVEGVYQGLEEALRVSGGTLLGGDCSSGSQRILSITALGCIDPRAGGPLRRGDGRPGDLLVATGPHGLSRLGLALLRAESLSAVKGPRPHLTASLQRRAENAHRRPAARFDALEMLAVSRPKDQPWRVGGCDSSDGLAAAVMAIAASSGCSALLDRDHLPVVEEMRALAQAESWCLGGGEDFELVLALDPAWARRLIGELAESTLIGELVPRGSEGLLRWKDSGGVIDPGRWGYSHFG